MSHNTPQCRTPQIDAKNYGLGLGLGLIASNLAAASASDSYRCCGLGVQLCGLVASLFFRKTLLYVKF